MLVMKPQKANVEVAMSLSTLIKTVVVSNAVAGEYKFEIFQDEDANFYADISRKGDNGTWVFGRDGYGFSQALDLDDAVNGCVKFVNNLVTDHDEIISRKRTS